MNKGNQFKQSNIWEKRFTEPGISFIQVARNVPEKAIIVSNKIGNYEIHSVNIISGKMCQLSNRPEGTLFGSISPDGKYVYYFDDMNGTENGHFMRIPFSGGAFEDITPLLPQYFSFSVSSDDSNSFIIFSASVGNENRIYIVSTEENRKKNQSVLYSTIRFLQEPIINSNGSMTCCVVGKSETEQPKLLILDNVTGKIIKEKVLDSSVTSIPLAFRDRKVLLLTNQSGVYTPAIFDLEDDEYKILNNHQLQKDVFVLGWKDDNGLLIVAMKEGKEELYVYDYVEGIISRIGPEYGCFDLSFGTVSFLKNGNIALKWQSFGIPPTIIELVAPSYKSWTPNIRFEHLNDDSDRSIEDAHCKSSDGSNVHMLVACPKEKYFTKGRAFPFIIDVHGGPHGISRDEYSPRAHMWLDQGYGYCAVNYRGSIGFGKDYERKIYGNPGYWEVEDIVSAREWLIEHFDADPGNIVITGWSWGGYVTLLALGKYPTLWKCGIAGTAIADCVMQYYDSPASFKAFDDEIFGGNPKDTPDIYKNSSPISYASEFSAPILVIQGENDNRCTPHQMRHFESTLKSLGKDITVKWFYSGHAGEFSNTRLRIENAKMSLDFINQHIKILKKRNPEAMPRDL